MMRHGAGIGPWGRGAALLVACLAGCDGTGRPGSDVPPTAPVSETASVAVLLPGSGLAEVEVWEQAARRQEERTRSLVDVYRLLPGDPPSRQAELVKEAIAKGASALIVVAADPPSLATALAEARDSGIPIVLIDRKVPMPGKAPPLVVYEPEIVGARKLVAAAAEDAKALGYPADGPAILLINGPADDHGRARRKALRQALEEAGIHVVPDKVFSGLIDEGQKALAAAMLTTPLAAIVIADEDHGLSGAVNYRHNLDHDKKRFVLAGFCADRAKIDLARSNVVAGVVDRNINAPMAKAFELALAQVRGETVPDVVEIPTPLHRSNGPEDQASSFLGKPTPTRGQ